MVQLQKPIARRTAPVFAVMVRTGDMPPLRVLFRQIPARVIGITILPRLRAALLCRERFRQGLHRDMRFDFHAHVAEERIDHLAPLIGRQPGQAVIRDDAAQRFIQFLTRRFGRHPHIDRLLPHREEIVEVGSVRNVLGAESVADGDRHGFLPGARGFVWPVRLIDADIHIYYYNTFYEFIQFSSRWCGFFALVLSSDTIRSVSLTPAQVRHIAKLARLTIREDEVGKFAKELSAILDYIEKLKEVDTKGVEPIDQITGQRNVTRDDTICDRPVSTDALLAASPLPIVDQQIETPSSL